MANHKILSADEIQQALTKLKGWSQNGNNLEAEFKFKTFRDAIAYIVQIGIEAEVMNHHPEFYNSYNLIKFSFCTHDVGNKITDTDIKLAAKLTEIAERLISIK